MAVRIEAHAEPIPGYRLLDRLGAGGFGEVWRAEAPGGIYKAIKIIHGDLRSKDSDLIRYAEQELKSLKRVKQVRHPYLLALDRYDIIEGRLLIVMELADCNLWDRFRECRDRGLPGIPRDELLLYMNEIAEVLDLFNDQFQLQHLDIKPQNLFLLYNHIKVADFGQVKDLQGIMAQVTGGITPVYAAPETFDGVITRYCDQYSLACVYQELLSGVRPFDGCSMSQLLMQHLNLPPNLEPSPSCDRPALARALAKRPEDRWPSVTAFVRALQGGVPHSPRGMVPNRPALHELPTEKPASTSVPESRGGGRSLVVNLDDTPPASAEQGGPMFTPAPPEVSGPGPLRPALVIGLGQAGLRVVQRLRFELEQQFGPPEMTPALRLLYVDTDADSLDEASRPRLSERLAALAPSDIFPAKLNRAGHYLKPRLNGRSLTEGWFDPQLLYRLPRTPQTMGLRLFGRLAFCDHYRPLLGRIQAELETAVSAESLAVTERRTGLQLRTNRPSVYIVTSLAGGTGSGMFIDVAYAVRSRLQRMGYECPEVIGLLMVPPADLSQTSHQALGNTYAALTELNHFSRPDTTFTASYDERHGTVHEKGSPFTRCYFIPGNTLPSHLLNSMGTQTTARGSTPVPIPVPGMRSRPAGTGSGPIPKPGSRLVNLATASGPTDTEITESALRPFALAANFIRLNLFTAIGRTVDAVRSADELASPPGTLANFGLATFSWPRTEVIGRVATIVTRRLLKKWAAPDVHRAREKIPAIAQVKWAQLGLEPDTIRGHLERAADRAGGGKIEDQLVAIANPLVPRGWLSRIPEPQKVTLALDRLLKLLGPPTSMGRRSPTAVEQALTTAAVDAGAAFAHDVRTLVPVLVDDPEFRLSGAEEVVCQFLAATERLCDRLTQSLCELDAKAQTGFECLSHYAHVPRGAWRPSVGEFTEAVREYPRARFQALLNRTLLGIYQAVREALSAELANVSAARQRLEAMANLPDVATVPVQATQPNRWLMPPGCANLAEAIDRFLAVITDVDLCEIDRRVQAMIEHQCGGVLEACLNSAHGPERVVATIHEEARAYLEMRLGEVDLAAMLIERFRTPQQLERAIEQKFQEAEPTGLVSGFARVSEIAVVGCPNGPAGEPLRELARRAIPVAGLPFADVRDDLIFYREQPAVPFAAIPQLGAIGAEAYAMLLESQQCSAHARLDITLWKDAPAN